MRLLDEQVPPTAGCVVLSTNPQEMSVPATRTVDLHPVFRSERDTTCPVRLTAAGNRLLLLVFARLAPDDGRSSVRT